MRIAIVSDIHSNIEALTKAFSLIDNSSVDEVYCLGDIVGYGANPNECLDIIRRRAAKVVIGNHDMAVIEPEPKSPVPAIGRVVVEWTKKVLTEENRQYLMNLPLISQNSLCTLVHASPENPAGWDYIVSLENASRQFEYFSTPLCFIGHTHIPSICGDDLKTFHLKRGRRSIINVGSVGQPRDGNPDLSFGILDTDTWEYVNIRSPYDVDSASQAIVRNGLSHSLARRLFWGM